MNVRFTTSHACLSWLAGSCAILVLLAASSCGTKAPPVNEIEPGRADGDRSAAEAPLAGPESTQADLAAEEIVEPVPMPDTWVPVTCPATERAMAELFELGDSIDTFDAGVGEWRPIAGGQQARSILSSDAMTKHAGAASLKVDYEFSGDKELEYVDFGRSFEIREAGAGLGLMVKTDGTGLRYRIRLTDSSGETHQLDLLGSPSTEWSLLCTMLDAKAGSWGGDGNHKLDYPVRFSSLVADRPKPGYVGKGTLWLDSVAYVSPRSFVESIKTDVGDARFGNVYEPGEYVHVRARANGKALQWRVEDYFGATLTDGSATGEAATCSYRLTRPGYYRVVFERVADGVVLEGRYFPCAALPEIDDKPRNDIVGFCSHFRWGAYPLTCMDLMKRYGFRHFRDEIAWQSFEEQPKKYSMPEYGTSMMDRARQLEMSPLLILDYSNPHYDANGFPNSDEAIAGYAQYGVELVRAAKGVVTQVEIWNEWILGCGMDGKPGEHTPEAYGRMLKPAYADLKAAFPDLTVVGMGGFCIRPFPEMVARAISTSGPKSMDAISIHPYRYPNEPEESDLVGEVTEVAKKARELGAPQKIWASELGWPTHTGPSGVNERTQARYIVRAMALLQATGVVERVYWYDFKNDGLNREYNENNFGVVHHQDMSCAPKPAVVAASVFSRLSADATPTRSWHEGARHVVFYSKADGTDLAVAWTNEGTAEVEFTGSVRSVLDMMGNPARATRSVTLDEDPVYVVGSRLGTPKVLLRADDRESAAR